MSGWMVGLKHEFIYPSHDFIPSKLIWKSKELADETDITNTYELNSVSFECNVSESCNTFSIQGSVLLLFDEKKSEYKTIGYQHNNHYNTNICTS